MTKAVTKTCETHWRNQMKDSPSTVCFVQMGVHWGRHVINSTASWKCFLRWANHSFSMTFVMWDVEAAGTRQNGFQSTRTVSWFGFCNTFSTLVWRLTWLVCAGLCILHLLFFFFLDHTISCKPAVHHSAHLSAFQLTCWTCSLTTEVLHTRVSQVNDQGEWKKSLTLFLLCGKTTERLKVVRHHATLFLLFFHLPFLTMDTCTPSWP